MRWQNYSLPFLFKFYCLPLYKINPTETKNTAMNPKTIKVFFLSILCMMLVAASQAASLVQGRIYLKDGSIIECAEKDRLKIPKHSQNVKLLRRAYYKDKSKENAAAAVEDDDAAGRLTSLPGHLTPSRAMRK